MPLETASYIDNLNASNPASTDLVGQADDHIRLVKAVLKATFPNLTGPITKTQTEMNQGVPLTGIICLWYGSSGTIPSGWVLCNGLNGTPNLVDRIPIGAGTIAAQGITAGASTTASATTGASGAHSHSVTNVAHTHTATTGGTAITAAQMPSHSHNLKVAPLTVDAGGSITFTNISTGGTGTTGYTDTAGTGATHDHTVTVANATAAASTSDTAATHTHTVNGVAIIPPVLGLHYIMKT